jgi:proline dehydrogenase
LHPEFGDLAGVVIQSYMRRSAADVEALVDMQARVRLCKGAYAEPADIAFQERREVSESFVKLMKHLVQRGNYPGIATHDEELVKRTIEFVKQENISADRFEFQMLYGVRRDLQQKLRNDGYNMRVYIPFGTQWYPYLMRRLAERPANLVFITVSVLKEARSWK